MGVTSKDIARICGVSRATVDRALHDKPRIDPQTKERILKVAEEMGYRFQQFLPADINMGRATMWLRNLKASYGPVQTIPTIESD